MSWKELVKYGFLIGTLCMIIFFSGCIEGCDNPAPGCCPSFGATGCFGKSVILNSEGKQKFYLYPSPKINCLDIEVNNCNGGVLEVSNKCEEKIYFEDYEIPSCFKNVTLKNGTIVQNCYPVGIEIIRDKEGNLDIIKSSSNAAEYNPSKNDTIVLDISWGQNKSTLTFIKTAMLC